MIEIKKLVTSISKYAVMFLLTVLLCHVISGATLDSSKCLYIALGTSTVFIIVDYIAPSQKIYGSIQINNDCDMCNKEKTENN